VREVRGAAVAQGEEASGMRLLVTGGAGFIGANFVHYMREVHPAWELVVLDALTYAGNLESLVTVRGEIEVVVGSVTDEALVDELVARCDAIVHFAAESHNDNSLLAPLQFVRTNVLGTAVLLQAARLHDRRFHHVSTDEVYGALALDDPQRFTPEHPYRPSSMYSASKAGADHLVRAAVVQLGVRATLSNCSNNYGPFQHVEKFIPRTITNVLCDVKPRLYGDGKHVRDWIHVMDHNRAVDLILQHGRIGETYLIGAHGEETNDVLLETILELMDRPPGWLEVVRDRPAHDRRYAIDSTKLRKELGWRPLFTDLRDGLMQTIEWYRDNESWWRPQKDLTEARYRELGQ
jgi:dTDP-glucose 4,6-dehydratase